MLFFVLLCPYLENIQRPVRQKRNHRTAPREMPKNQIQKSKPRGMPEDFPWLDATFLKKYQPRQSWRVEIWTPGALSMFPALAPLQECGKGGQVSHQDVA